MITTILNDVIVASNRPSITYFEPFCRSDSLDSMSFVLCCYYDFMEIVLLQTPVFMATLLFFFFNPDVRIISSDPCYSRATPKEERKMLGMVCTRLSLSHLFPYFVFSIYVWLIVGGWPVYHILFMQSVAVSVRFPFFLLSLSLSLSLSL